MAISFTTSSYSADFIPSGAARVESKGSAGGSQFAEMLGSQGSGNSRGSKDAGSVNSSASLLNGDKSVESIEKSFAESESADVSDWEKLDGGYYVAPIAEEKTVDIPESDAELAEAIVNGDISIDDVPEERITYALLKAIIAAKFKKKLEDDRKAVDPKEKGNDQSNPSELVDARLAVLYKLIDAYVEANSEDPDKAADGLMKRIDELTAMTEGEEKRLDLIALISQLLGKIAEAEDENGETAIPQQFFDRLKEEIGEENAKLLEQAIKDGEVLQIEKVIRKIAEQAPEQVKRFDTKPIVKSEISEELEMLRSAKQNHARNVEDEFTEPLKAESEIVKAAVEVQPDGAKSEGESEQNGGMDTENGAQFNSGANSQNADKADGAKLGAAAAADSPIIFRAEDGAELEIQPSEVVSQAMRIVEQSLKDTAEQTEYSLTLNPGELGRITVRMVKAADGAVSVTIAAENAQTQRILETNSALMQNNLRNNGIQLESWQTVSESQQETLAQDYNGSSKNPYYREDAKSDEDEQPEESFADIIAAM